MQLRIRKKGGEWSEWSAVLALVEDEDAKARAAKPAPCPKKDPPTPLDDPKPAKPSPQVRQAGWHGGVARQAARDGRLDVGK